MLVWRVNSACFPVHLSEGLSKEVEKEVGDLGALAKSGWPRSRARAWGKWRFRALRWRGAIRIDPPQYAYHGSPLPTQNSGSDCHSATLQVKPATCRRGLETKWLFVTLQLGEDASCVSKHWHKRQEHGFFSRGVVYNASFRLWFFVGGIYSEQPGLGSSIVKQTFTSHACDLVKPLMRHSGFYHVCLASLFSLTD